MLLKIRDHIIQLTLKDAMNRIYLYGDRFLTLGRRPQEEGGHKGVRLSLNKACRDVLARVKSGGESMSRFVEDAILAKAYHQTNPHTLIQPEPINANSVNHRISVQVNYKLELRECMSIAESATLT